MLPSALTNDEGRFSTHWIESDKDFGYSWYLPDNKYGVKYFSYVWLEI